LYSTNSILIYIFCNNKETTKQLRYEKNIPFLQLCFIATSYFHNPQSIYKKLNNNQLKPIFHAMGSEPYWDLYLMDELLLMPTK
jgi:hypothetical protein